MNNGYYKWKQKNEYGSSLFKEKPKKENIYKQRIDKAIEYIENAHFMNINYKDGLLKILKGDNEE